MKSENDRCLGLVGGWLVSVNGCLQRVGEDWDECMFVCFGRWMGCVHQCRYNFAQYKSLDYFTAVE